MTNEEREDIEFDIAMLEVELIQLEEKLNLGDISYAEYLNETIPIREEIFFLDRQLNRALP